MVRDVDQPELAYTSKYIYKEGKKAIQVGKYMLEALLYLNDILEILRKLKKLLIKIDDFILEILEFFSPEHGNTIRIVDRIKNIFKLLQRENISPEKIENIYKSCKYSKFLFMGFRLTII